MENRENMQKWSEIDKSSPFIAPDGYFDTLQNKISDRIAAQEKGVGIPWFSLARWARPVLAMAVVVAGCFFAFSKYNNDTASLAPAEQVADVLPNDETVDRLLYMNDMADAMSEETFFTEEEIVSPSGLTDEEILYYLLNNNVEMGDIISMMYAEE